MKRKRAEKEVKKYYRWSFPTFAVIILVFAVIWFLSELGYIAGDRVPWLPIIIGIIAIGMIIKHTYHK